ncbi:hypothetical protein ILUMI_11395 [Ignelater luminosus]|uniref:Luciferin 4-monooxygenase n=1 Tax=Ignelater luminosus TaxID=2038154 RepID=A0A8K0G7S4_IGNLU|nr:hypothetical protein ILUMI_11395 [Ignelater luminosus]
MSDKSCNIISGPQPIFCIQEKSVGKYLFECLKKRDPKHVTMTDISTGRSLETGKILQDSVKATRVLQELGIQKGDVIAIVAENTVTYCIPQLAAFYMGVTVHLLNPVYSKGELKHAFEISKPKLIICSQLSVQNVTQTLHESHLEDVKIVLLEGTLENHINITSFENLLENTDFIDPKCFEPETFDSSEQPAMILMSSGTTGLPKGVLLSHKNIRATFEYLLSEEYIGATDTDVTIFILPFFHVFGILIQILSLAVGSRLMLMKNFKPDVYLESIQKYKAKKLYMVPPMLVFLAKSHLVNNYNVSSVEDIVVGGAPLGKQLFMDATKRLPNVSIRQLYGATEVCGASTITKRNNIVIGTAGVLVPNIAAKVWDSDLKKVVKPSTIGELCFKGPMIMKGYVGNESDTKLCIDEEGFLHSGDLGFFDENGHIHIVDRIKELIKYKGFQVAPAELEALILTHAAVKECGVIGIPDDRAGQIPLAYVVRQNGVDVSQQDIIDYVAERISVQKHLYGGVRFIDEIPKSASGKILRRKLIEMFSTSL